MGNYVANDTAPGTVSVMDTATNTVVATIGVGIGPTGVAITPDGKHAYVANPHSNNVSVIDTASNMVVATVTVGANPNGVAVTPDGKHAYVTNAGSSNNVSVKLASSRINMPDGCVGNGGTGFTATGREAREACEARIPEITVGPPASGAGRHTGHA
jgi:YVTN family beta-propeller protein